MSSFRRPKSEASLRLYNLPRRELQALCKQYGIPANKTNVAMADALSACIPADNAKPKASAKPILLGVSKTTEMKQKLEKKIGLPETSLAAFISTGKRKASPTKLVEQPTEVEEAGFPKPNTMPLKRGVKRTERPVEALQEEKSKVTAVHAFTRAAAFQDRFGKVATAVSCPKPRAPTLKKRAAEAAAVVTRRGGDALPPVSFYDLVSTPKKSQAHVVIELTSTGKTANKMMTRLGLRTGPQEEEATLSSSHAGGAVNEVSKGKRVAFADEVELQKNASPESELQPEPETETNEISYPEIEFKDAATHKELFGFQSNITMEEEQDVASVLKEELENRGDASDSTREATFEFRDMALHHEILGSHGRNESKFEKVIYPPSDLQEAGTELTSDLQEVESDSVERGISNSLMSSPAVVLNHSNNIAAQDHPVLYSICEDACEGSGSQGEALEEQTERHLPQGCAPSPLLDDVSHNILAENRSEKSIEVADYSHAISLGCSMVEMQSDPILPLEQEPSLTSDSDVHLVIDAERDLGDIQRHQSENLDVVMLADGMDDESIRKQCFEETLVSSVPALDESQKAHSGPTPEFDGVQISPQGMIEKENSDISTSVSSAKKVVTAGPELVMWGPNSANISFTPAVNVQDNSAKRLSGLRSSSIPVTPATIAHDNSAKRLSGPSSPVIPVTPVTTLQDNSDSALAKAATPLSKIQSNIDSTLAKATSILEKLASWRADAEKKMREGYWEPKFSTVVENATAAPVVEKPIAKTVLAVDREIPSTKKARPTLKNISGSEKGLTVCEDTDIVSKGDMPSAKKMSMSDESRASSEVSDKENQSDKSFRRFGAISKEKKKQGKKSEVLQDRSKNLPDHGNALATIKESTGLVRPGDMSLRKLRAQVKQKVSQLENSKASPLRSQKSWTTSH